MHHPTDRIAHTTAFVTPVVEHWLEREIAQWVRPMKDRSDNPSHHEQTLLPWSYISLLKKKMTKCTVSVSANIPEMQITLQPMGSNAIWPLQPLCDAYDESRLQPYYGQLINNVWYKHTSSLSQQQCGKK